MSIEVLCPVCRGPALWLEWVVPSRWDLHLLSIGRTRKADEAWFNSGQCDARERYRQTLLMLAAAGF